jgi:S-disulfanyl-L-cysteine oxidoreductase SoxD
LPGFYSDKLKTTLMQSRLFSFSIALCLLIVWAMLSSNKNDTRGDRMKHVQADTTTWPQLFGFGKPATKEKIAAWDIDIRPNGKGLPEGSGNVKDGKKVYRSKCVACHGENGTGGVYSRLVTSDTSKEKTIGNYWPYATTVFDYIRRAMPFNSPGSLTDEEVYNVTAYLLAANRIIDSNMVINRDNLPAVDMPAKHLFISDDRKGGPEVR